MTAELGDDVAAFIVRGAAGPVTDVERKMGLHALPTTGLELERVEVGQDALLGGTEGADVQAIPTRRVSAWRSCSACSRRARVLRALHQGPRRSTSRSPRSSRSHSASPRCTSSNTRCASSSGRARACSSTARTRRRQPAPRSYAAEKSMWIADNGVQILGGHGFIREHLVEMWFRNARTLGVMEACRPTARRCAPLDALLAGHVCADGSSRARGAQ